VFVSLVAYFYYTTPNIGVLYIYNNNNNNISHRSHSIATAISSMHMA